MDVLIPTDVSSETSGCMFDSCAHRGHQDADPDVNIWLCRAVFPGRSSSRFVDRGYSRILSWLWVDHHEGGMCSFTPAFASAPCPTRTLSSDTLHLTPVPSLRTTKAAVGKSITQTSARLRSSRLWELGRWCSCRAHDAFGCPQDPSHARSPSSCFVPHATVLADSTW